MSTTTDCKRSLEIEIPLDQVNRARERVTNSLKQRVRLPGFRPGKAPTTLIQSRFESEIRSEVLDVLLPEAFQNRIQEQGLNVVSAPKVTELHYEPDQPIRFKADFEVAPEFELGDYRGLPVKYEEPTVADEELEKRLESVRESKADYVNLDPRPIESGDYVLVHLKSLAGLAEPVDQDTQIQVGGAETLPGFNEALIGASPGEIKEVEVTYPEDFGSEPLAGKTVGFEIAVKTLRKKELPALDDEFAKDLGDYQTLDELKDALRKSIFHEKQYTAQQQAKEELIDRLVERHPFPVPEAYIERQIQNQVQAQLQQISGQNIDVSKLNLDWTAIKDKQSEKASRNVRASLLLGKISEREGIAATKDEVEREVQRVARQNREAVPVTRARLEKEGGLGRMAAAIQTEKTLQFLFDNAQKQV
ncbi:MAG: trigger factor [Acidobacteriaceae bacterium]|nr:trigger factor [Acidobacteriaceae bacterium]